MTVSIKMPTKIVKRSGEIVDFDTSKIHVALQKCFSAVPHSSDVSVDQLVRRICSTAYAKYSVNLVSVPTVENIQDIVEMVLQSEGEFEAAKHYILFRAERTRLRNERPIPPEVRAAFDADKKYFPTAIQSFQFYDKYSRFNYDLGRRETWVETVDRAVTFLHKLTGPKIDRETYEEIRMAILEHKIMPSMRLLAMAGKPAERDNTTIYNCSYLPVDSLESFVEALFISMAGCGVGFSVEEVEVQKLPQIKLQIENKYPVNHIVDDSAEGWGVALRVGLHAWFNGEDVLYNFSNVRPAGSVLLTKGGRASGPEPLQKLLAFAKNRILARQGKRLRTIDAHDIMCAVGSAAVAGGVRRTAMISLFDEDDELMLNSKAGDFAQHNSQRWNANNSVVWSGSDPVAFMKQFTTMVEGERGEPGIFSRENSRSLAPLRRATVDIPFGTNPCFAPETTVSTIYGPKQIKDITEPTYVYSMDKNKKLVISQASASWITRRNAETVIIEVANGKKLTVTPEHKIYVDNVGWVEAQKLKYGDRVVGLCRNRRGVAYSGVKLTTQTRDEYVMEHRLIWEGVNGSIPAGYDINHKDQDTYHNSYDNFELLTHSQHATLTRQQCSNNHQVRDRDGRFISGPNSFGGMKYIVPMPEDLKTNWHQYATVISVKDGPVTDVYDISVEGTNNLVAEGIIAHNCGEIVLRPRQFCNLSAVINRAGDTYNTLSKKVRLATIVGTIQSTATYFPNLSGVWQRNCEDERLLGVDITGQLDNYKVLSQRDSYDGKSDFYYLKQVAYETNFEFAQKLGINQSAAITTVKPSGNTSVFVDCSSGLHARWAPYYIKNARVSIDSPLYKVMRDAGVPMAPENGGDNRTMVVSFPIKSPDGAITRNDRTAIEQCEWWLLNKTEWTEHNPSVTITYKPDEVIDLQHWLWNHRDKIGGMAFLPSFDAKYDQLPYIEITKEEYERRAAEFPDIDWAKIFQYEYDDQTKAAQELACVSGVCSVDEIQI